MSQSRGRLIFLTVIWLLSLAYYAECAFLPRFSEKITVTLAFSIFTLLTAVEWVRQARVYRTEKASGKTESGNFRRRFSDKRVQLSGAMIFYLVLIPQAGFYAASFLAFIAFSVILGTRSWSKVAFPGILVLGLIYFIFTWLLKLTLPSGFLF